MMKKTLLSIALIFALVFNASAFANEANLKLPKDVLVFMKFMLGATGKSEEEKIKAFDEAYDYLQRYWDTNSGEFLPESLSDYLAKTDGDKPEFLSLETELDYFRTLERISHYRLGQSVNPQVKDEIQSYRMNQAEQAQKIVSLAIDHLQSNTAVGVDIFRTTTIGFIEKLFSDWDGMRENIPALLKAYPLENFDRETKLQVATAFEGVFLNLMSEIRDLGDKIGGSMATEGRPAIQRSVEILFSEYFKNETDAAIQNMISGLLDNPGETDNVRRMGIVLQFAAPNLLKLLQLIARQDGISPRAVEVLSKLEDEIRGASFYAIKKLLLAEMDDMRKAGIEVDLDKVDQVALKAATIGQIHLGEIDLTTPQKAILFDEDTGKLEEKEIQGPMKVVFRFTKPGSEKRAEEGRDIMSKVAQVMDADPILIKAAAPKAGPLVDALYEGIKNDLNLPGTGERQRTGIKKYTFEEIVETADGQKVRLVYKVPHLIFVGKSVSVMEMVSGGKLTKIHEVNESVAQKIASRMSLHWFHEAYFKGGFFHADMHPGNFLVKAVKNTKISVKKYLFSSREVSIPTFLTNILDFGMGGIAELGMRKNVFGMMVAAMAFDSELLAKISWENRDQKESLVSSWEEFRKSYDPLIQQANSETRNAKEKVRLYINAVNESGIRFDPIMAGLIRGTTIQSLLAATVKQPTTFQGFMGELLKERPALLSKLVATGELMSIKPKLVAAKVLLSKGANACVNIFKSDSEDSK